jgi:hypothetical protein
MTRESDRTGPTWEQFGLRHDWGKQKGNEHRNESKKVKKKRLKGNQKSQEEKVEGNTKQCKEEEKEKDVS